MKLTKEQQHALRNVFLRSEPEAGTNRRWVFNNDWPKSYLQFRRAVQPGPDCVMINWQGMWLGIEPDGYTHS